MNIDDLKKEERNYLLLLLRNEKKEINDHLKNKDIDQEEGSSRLETLFFIEHAVSPKQKSELIPTPSKISMGAYKYLRELLENAEESNRIDIQQDGDRTGARQKLDWIERIKVAIIDLAED